MLEHYNPKPVKYEGITKLHEWFDNVRDRERDSYVLHNFQYILQGVTEQQMNAGAGILHYSERHSPAEIVKQDSWVTQHRGQEFSDDWTKKFRYLYEIALKEAKEIGLCTYHSATGRAIGLPSYSDGYIRVNPDAYRDLLKVFSRRTGGDTWDARKSLRASETDPGWYEVPRSVADQYKGAALLHCQRYILTKEFETRVSHRGGSPRLLVRSAGEEVNPDAAIMEACLSRYDLTDLLSYGEDEAVYFKKVFPSVDPRVFLNNLYSLTAVQTLEDEEATKLRQMQELIKAIREIRSKKNLIKSYGGREGLLTAMGKDLSVTIPCNCTTWITLPKHKNGRAASLLYELSDDFISGRLILGIPGTNPLD
jgi:hypothetical protein